MSRHEPAFETLDEFWRRFVKVTTAGRAPPFDPAAITGFLSLMFGRLADHALVAGNPFPVTIGCTNCRNNQGERSVAACLTHVGSIRGLLESVTASPLKARYNPSDVDDTCRITVTRATVDDGRALLPTARLRDGLSIVTRDEGIAAEDAGAGAAIPLTATAAAVLAALGGGAQAGEVTRRTGLDEEAVVSELAQAWRAGLIGCDFTPETVP